MGPCPISVPEAKRKIRYVTPQERAALADKLLSVPLATWQYRLPADTPEGQQTHLGFMIDGSAPPEALRASGDQVDLYGYTSLTVATLQTQAEQIKALTVQIEALTERVEAAEARCQE